MPVHDWWYRWWNAPFMPHGHCYLWRPAVLWTHVLSDALIAISYYSIPVILLLFLRRRTDVPFHRLMVVFAIFILACGTTHLLDIINVWEPLYRLQAVVKVVTAAVSVLAVILLIPAVPHALRLPSLAATNRQLEQTAEELRRRNHDLAQFAYVASHDLQEPLRMVTLNLDVLERRLGSDLDERSSQHIAFAREGADRMRALLDGLLSFGLIDDMPPARSSVDPQPAVVSALASVRAELDAAGGTITVDPLPPLPSPTEHLALLFHHLFTNGIRFRAPDRILRIRVVADDKGERIRVRVIDNGIGIEPAHRQAVFRMFHRLHERGRYPGIGVGLASVRRIVERNGGSVAIIDGDAGGIAVEFSFPRSGPASA